MIRVTQGHEDSISLEVFLKSFLLLNNNQQSHVILYCHKESLEKNCRDLQLNFSIIDDYLEIENTHLKLSFNNANNNPSIDSLLSAISDMTSEDVLFTLPTSKDQFIYNGKQFAGHTDFFRYHFNNINLAMCFSNSFEKVLLLTDHIPLKEVSTNINSNLIIEKTSIALNMMTSIKNVIFSGINPHAGENGLLGKEEVVFSSALKELKSKFKHINFFGPISGDALHTFKLDNQLKIYSYHDQGLSYFKGLYNFNGANITLGLPFIRVSVDHGTAFELYGQNKANYFGCYELLKDCINKRIL